MHYASFSCTMGSPKAPWRSRAELSSMYQYAMIILLSVQQTREHSYTAPRIQRGPSRDCSLFRLFAHTNCRGAQRAADTCSASCTNLQPSRHA